MPKGSGGGARARKVTASLLDELMGKDRNRPLTERSRRRNHFSDPDYCKFYLCGFCPFMLFTNTKSFFGQCNDNHSDMMKEMWEKLNDEERASYRYEDDFQDFLEDRVRDIEKEISKRKSRSEKSLSDLPPADPEMLAQKAELEAEIDKATEEMDRLNEECLFEDAKVQMMKIEQLQQEVKKKTRDIDNKRTLETGKILGVCDVCGVLIGIGDEQADARHLVGKQHLGYEQIRSKLQELRETQDRRRALRKQFRERKAEREKKEAETEKSNDQREAKRDAKREDQQERNADYARYRY